MDTEIKNKFIHLASLVRNPLADIDNIICLKKELEYVNTATFSVEDWQLYYQVFK